MSTDTTTTTTAVCDFRHEFDRQVRALDAKVNSFCIADGEHYARIVREVTEAKCRARKRPLDYRRLKRYDVVTTDDDDDDDEGDDDEGDDGGDGDTPPPPPPLLVLPPPPPLLVLPPPPPLPDNGKRTTDAADRPHRRRYLHNGQLFDALKKSHLDTGHGGLHKMHVDLKRRYANVTRPVIQIFLANCETCRRRRRGRRRVGDSGCDRKTVRRLHPLMERAHVDLIDGNCGDGLVMVYQDCRTKFVVLRALGSPAEVCDRLTEVFCLFGAPAALCFARCAATADRAFRDRLTDACCTAAWPRLRVVWTGSLSAVLKSWRRDGPLSSFQHQYNNTLHPDVGRSPFQALFGGGGGCGGGGVVVGNNDVDNAAVMVPMIGPDAAVHANTPPDSRRRSVITRAPASTAPVPIESAADRTLRMAAVAVRDGWRPADRTTVCYDNVDDDENDAFLDRSDHNAKKSFRKQCRPAKRVRSSDVVVGAKRL